MERNRRRTVLTVTFLGMALGSAVQAAATEPQALAEELMEKYSQSRRYSGEVLSVQRDENVELQLGFNPWSLPIMAWER